MPGSDAGRGLGLNPQWIRFLPATWRHMAFLRFSLFAGSL